MKGKKYLSLPVTFAERKEFSFDDSLIPVDIKVMHDGLNLNGSTFFEDAIKDAKESLKNKPILGYVKKKDGSDEQDFAGHEMEIVLSDEGIKTVYLERPLGTVPETNSYSISEEDGRKYVMCRGYLWKEYLNSGYEILKDNPNKSVSMEIAVDDYEYNDEDGTFNILKFRYLGITILGDDVQPGMAGAELNVVGQFSERNDDFYNKIEELNEKVKDHFTNKNIEGGEEELNKNTQEEVLDKEVVDKTSEKLNKDDEKKDKPDDYKNEEETKEENLEEDDDKEDYTILELAYDVLKEKYLALEKSYTDLYAEKEKYKKFHDEKVEKEVALEKEEIFEKFESALKDTEIFAELSEKRNDYSVEEIQYKLSVSFADISLKSKKKDKKKESEKVPFERQDIGGHDSPYGILFEKYGNK